MKKLLLSIAGILLSSVGFAQFDGGQPDSVYKINKVRTMLLRYDGWGRQNCILTTFDTNGKILKWTMFDKKGEKKWLETIYDYDSTGKLIKLLHCSYINHDKTFEDMPDSILDSSKVNTLLYKYDASGRLVKISGTLGPDRTSSVTSFYYNPLISVWKFHKLKDSLETTHITVYETPEVVKSFFSSYDSGKVTKNSWQEVNTNIFDRSGRLVKRFTEFPGIASPCQETFYEYNEKGLLIRKYIHVNSLQKDVSVRLYDYEYWDDCVIQPVVVLN